jgi:hypothetical protein
VDTKGGLVAVDLESRSVRKQPTGGIAVAGVGPDGSLFLSDADNRVEHIVRRNTVIFHDLLPAPPRALFGAVNDQLVAVTIGPNPKLITANAEQTLYSTGIPAGEVTATLWGDLVAVAADTAAVLYETLGRRLVTSVRARRHVKQVAFSPSGHRLYVAEDDNQVLTYDRFTLREIARLKLPDVPRALRVDVSGRWMLARPASGDSIWVVDLATNRLAAEVPGEWASDLPVVAGAATVLVRRGQDVATFDLRRAPARQTGILLGGAVDLWLVAAWVPRERMMAAAAAAESATVVQDSALLAAADSTISEGDSTRIYLQVSTSQNPEWAAQLAKQLKETGFSALVLAPRPPDDGYRVVVGPYPSRDAAEESGKKLGRPFFVLREVARRP